MLKKIRIGCCAIRLRASVRKYVRPAVKTP
jgi:hypothetical protein